MGVHLQKKVLYIGIEHRSCNEGSTSGQAKILDFFLNIIFK